MVVDVAVATREIGCGARCHRHCPRPRRCRRSLHCLRSRRRRRHTRTHRNPSRPNGRHVCPRSRRSQCRRPWFRVCNSLRPLWSCWSKSRPRVSARQHWRWREQREGSSQSASVPRFVRRRHESESSPPRPTGFTNRRRGDRDGVEMHRRRFGEDGTRITNARPYHAR